MKDEIIPLIQEMIRNRCVNPPGNEIKSIRTIERYLSSFGIESEVFESAPDRGNLLATIKGSGEGPSLMFGPGHVDVVPVENEDEWTVPPFEGAIKDGCVWGRGALDMLYIVACQAAVFAHLHAESFKPKGDLKFLVVSDEEIGGELGANWMVQNHPEKVKVDYLVTEAGGDPIGPNRVSFIYGEKGTAWTRMRFKGVERHGSAPFRSNNAVVKMAKAIQRVKEYQPPRDTSITKPFLKALGIGGVTLALFNQPRTFGFILNRLAKRSIGNAALIHSLSQMTWSPNVCRGGAKTNTVPGTASLDIDVRILPGQDEDYVLKHFRKALGPLADDVQIERMEAEEGGVFTMGSLSAVTSLFVELMESIVKEVRGSEFTIVPMVSPGATDCRFFRKAWNTQAYGFSIHDGSMDMGTLQSLFHGTDERIPIGTLEMTAKGYMELAKRFLS
ncbi:MAG: M20/M25/M40 family metallo-hydrolase [Candidatus Thorarchaeota archaeon]|jgi:acetylornithine deacetylase/succinyl-diaminopimelate desuccinylase-like protein